jgi:hypothetical protein
LPPPKLIRQDAQRDARGTLNAVEAVYEQGVVGIGVPKSIN